MASGAPRVRLVGGDVILADRVHERATVVVEDGVIAGILDGEAEPAADDAVDCRGCWIAPGFVDVHVHGVEGLDVLDGGGAVREVARRLPRYGVTAFCPTSIACTPERLSELLAAVGTAGADDTGAQVLPAHLESNFINPEYKGAQPGECLRRPSEASRADGAFTGREILELIQHRAAAVGIMTVAPEVDSVLDVLPGLVARGIHISIGHSGASYEEAMAAIDSGATQATHLFNRMTPVGHRLPGLAGAVLEQDRVRAELVCDGVHVHPAMMRVAIAAKGPSGIMAVTDGTAGSGLTAGTRSTLGGRPIHVRDAAYLDDGTLAGSVLTMDGAFARLVTRAGQSPVAAAAMCATSPSRALGLASGEIAVGRPADLVVLGRDYAVRATFREGVKLWPQ